MAQTQQQRKAETRARLLDAAATLFADRGIDAVSVDAVAQAAGRTSGAVYSHFGSKQGLLLALLDDWAHSLVTVIAAEFEVSSTVEDRLRAVAADVVTNPSVQTRRLLLLERELWLRAARDGDVATAMRARARDAHAWLSRGFAAWIADGVIPPADPDTLATVFRAMIVGLEGQHRIDPQSLDTDDVARILSAVTGATPAGSAVVSAVVSAVPAAPTKPHRPLTRSTRPTTRPDLSRAHRTALTDGAN